MVGHRGVSEPVEQPRLDAARNYNIRPVSGGYLLGNDELNIYDTVDDAVAAANASSKVRWRIFLVVFTGLLMISTGVYMLLHSVANVTYVSKTTLANSTDLVPSDERNKPTTPPLTKPTSAEQQNVPTLPSLVNTTVGQFISTNPVNAADRGDHNESPERPQTGFSHEESKPILIPKTLFEQASDAYNKRQYAVAFDIWKSLADQGDATSQWHIGLMYENGQGVIEDRKSALLWYKWSSDQGYADATKDYERLTAHSGGR
jgi:hypothetical protein